MTTAQRAFGGLIVAFVALTVVELVTFESLFALSDDPRVAERAALLILSAGLRYSVPVAMLYLVAQAILLLFWAARPPRPSRDPRETAMRLSEWLRWALVVVCLAVAACLATRHTSMSASIPLIGLTPLFGWAYAACVYRALQLQGYRHAAGLSRVRAWTVGVAAIWPALVMPVWPLGLAFPFWVWFAARKG
jgi:hypothetical protein